ncbi:unnamed protein product, partial [Oppiella nova]
MENNSNKSHYRSHFIDLSDNPIGTGGFGTVFKVKHKLDEQIYAVKRVEFQNLTYLDIYLQHVCRDVRSLRKVRSDYVVEYYNSWIEGNALYNQMEFCSQNLRNILEVKPQIVESVQYLHDWDPQIIHRDLKPENILIIENAKKGRFVKLCDFGLAVEHRTASQRHTKYLGTPDYMAPEVSMPQTKYGTKADIYSLGIIAMELFDIYLEYWD